MEYSERIKQFRQQKGVTQQQLADEIGVSRQSVVRWENGFAVPSMFYAQKLAVYFGVTVWFLMTGEEEKKSSENTDRDTREKYKLATVKFCIVEAAIIVGYALICGLIHLISYWLVQSNRDTYVNRGIIKSAYYVADVLVVIALFAILAYWIVRLLQWFHSTDDKYLLYRLYRLWNIGLLLWLTNVLTVVFLIYLYVAYAAVLYIAALFVAAPIDYVFDFIFKKVCGKRMVVPHNTVLGIINCVFAIVAAACVAAIVGWIIYAVNFINPLYGLEILFALMYFGIAVAVIGILYIIARATVHFTYLRRRTANNE